MGRPPKNIDPEGVYRLASYGCTQEEIADFYGCTHAVISVRFSQEYKLGKANVRKNIRMWQIRSARKGSDKMLIHLGQQYCGQSEKIEQTNTEGPQVKLINLPVKKDDSSDSGSGPPAGVADGGTGE